MEEIKFSIITGQDDSDLLERSDKIVKPAWPEFMMHDALANRHWSELYELFGAYQFVLAESKSGTLIASANSIPLAFDGEIGELPDEGWDWAIAKGVEDYRAGRQPNLLCALQIVINVDYQGQNLSPVVVEIMKALADQEQLKALVAPVRPMLKALYPLTPIEDYVRWKTSEGEPFDPWLRVHLREGAEFISICHQAMNISGTIAQWEEWTELEFPQSGPYVIEGALNPIEIDLEKNNGLYLEPNIWLGHPIR